MEKEQNNKVGTETLQQSNSQEYPHPEVINEGKTAGRPTPKGK